MTISVSMNVPDPFISSFGSHHYMHTHLQGLIDSNMKCNVPSQIVLTSDFHPIRSHLIVHMEYDEN